jgi:hypothetical protein
MDLTALVCWVLDPCLSCLRNCSRRFRTFGSRCEIIALILCGLPISHPRPYGTSLLFKTSFRPADLVHSAWRIVLEGFWIFGSRWAIIALTLCGLPISHSRPHCSLISLSRLHSDWQIPVYPAWRIFRRSFCNLWFPMRDHCTSPMWFTDLHWRPHGSLISYLIPHSVWQVNVGWSDLQRRYGWPHWTLFFLHSWICML